MGKGRVTIPTDLDVVPQTLEMIEEWGADAIRDCDGTEFPQKLKDTGAKIYATYYTTRKDNAWAKAHPEEIQQMYIMTSFHTAVADTLEIHLMDHLDFIFDIADKVVCNCTYIHAICHNNMEIQADFIVLCNLNTDTMFQAFSA